MKPFVALMIEPMAWEIIGVVALVMTLAGVWLNWRRQWHIAEIEEDVKNGKITVDQAWRQSRFVNRRATLTISGGVALVVLFVLGQAFF